MKSFFVLVCFFVAFAYAQVPAQDEECVGGAGPVGQFYVPPPINLCGGGTRSQRYLHYVHCATTDLTALFPWFWFDNDSGTTAHAALCSSVPGLSLELADNIHGVIDYNAVVEMRLNFCNVSNAAANYDSMKFVQPLPFTIPSISDTVGVAPPNVCTQTYSGDMEASYVLDSRPNLFWKSALCISPGGYAGNVVVHASVGVVNQKDVPVCANHGRVKVEGYEYATLNSWTEIVAPKWGVGTQEPSPTPAPAPTPPLPAQRVQPREYDNSLEVDSSYLVHWSADETTQKVHFAVEVNTVGWVGFGINVIDRMAGSDIVLAHVDPLTSNVYFSDRMADDRVEPPLDTTQGGTDTEKTLTGGAVVDGWQVIRFDWPYETTDPRDRGIPNGQMWLVWSHSNVSPLPLDASGEPASPLVQHTIAQPTRVALRSAVLEETCSSTVKRTRKYLVDQPQVHVETFNGGITLMEDDAGGLRGVTDTDALVEVIENSDVESGLDGIKTTWSDLAGIALVKSREGSSLESTASNVDTGPTQPPSSCPSGTTRVGEVLLPMPSQNPDPKMSLKWETNCDTSEVTFTVSGDGAGWFGVGFHDAGTAAVEVPLATPFMVDADIYQVTAADGTAMASDRRGPSGTSNGAPSDDAVDSILVGTVSGSKTGTRQTVSFRRAFDTSDAEDVKFELGRRVHVIYSYNSNSKSFDDYHTKARALETQVVDIFTDVTVSGTGPTTTTSTSSSLAATQSAVSGASRVAPLASLGASMAVTASSLLSGHGSRLSALAGVATYAACSATRASAQASATCRAGDIRVHHGADADVRAVTMSGSISVLNGATYSSVHLHTDDGELNTNFYVGTSHIVLTADRDTNMDVKVYTDAAGDLFIETHNFGGKYDLKRAPQSLHPLVVSRTGESIIWYAERDDEAYGAIGSGKDVLRVVHDGPGVINLISTEDVPLCTDHDCQYVDFRYGAGSFAGIYTIPAQDTSNVCWAFPIPPELVGRYAVRMDPIVDKAQHAHHMLSWVAGPPPNGDLSKCQMGLGLLFGWAVGSEAFILPQEAALPMYTEPWFYIQMHYDNPSEFAGVQDGSGMRLWLTDVARQFTAGHLWLGAFPFRPNPLIYEPQHGIPPQTPVYRTSSFCSFKSWGYEGYKIFAHLFHMHKHGTRGFTAIAKRDGGVTGTTATYTGQTINDPDEVYDFNRQEFIMLDPPVEITKDMVFNTVCQYDNDSPTEWAFGGDSTSDEMCIHALMVYPAPEHAGCGNHWTFDDPLHTYVPFKENNIEVLQKYPFQ